MPSGKRSSRSDENQIETSRPLDPGIYKGLAGVRLAMRSFLAFSEAAVSEAGVTSQQYQALLVIKVAPGGQIMVRELADQMLLQHHGAVQLVDRLATAGFAVRIPSAEDKRSVLIGLTPKGEELVERLARTHLKGMLANEPLLVESLKRLRRLSRLG
ncbi:MULTISPECIES: MarR family winged helix-turn-helix transcriptional regulator [Rhizobium]|uniref:DNA-binding MarR family transcriptional regulator n=1 Tax=Rhizobium paranaense TaxID=1650438 RepID=A0A7W8XSG9_9HYPH|nr:MarR family transcriptional regulator [Rhizobium paranaense]MBB5574767.1 DNA-binding MarR family transcriptional regulator [Rhizobium paranaense]